MQPRPDHAHMTQMDIDIVYYVATFISKSVKKNILFELVLMLKTNSIMNL